MNWDSFGLGVGSAVKFVPKFVSTLPDVQPTVSLYSPDSLDITLDFNESLNRLFFFFGFTALGTGFLCLGRPLPAPFGRLLFGAGPLRLAIVNK